MNSNAPCKNILLSLLFFTVPIFADVPGYTEPFKTITISAAEPGVIAEILVEEGARVKKGDILARLDTAQSEAELEISRATTALQKTRLQRLEILAKTQRAADDELERARMDLKIREAEVRKIEAVIATRTMRSPVDGLVTEIKRDPSEAVSLSNPHVLTVVQIDQLLVNLFLSPSRATAFKVGDSATLLLGEKNPQKATATVQFISPVIDAASGTIRVKFTLDNRDGRLPSGAEARLEK